MHGPVEFADIAADVFARIRTRAPRVHCLTNTVAQEYTANMLLGAGAAPSMTIASGEIAGLVASADVLAALGVAGEVAAESARGPGRFASWIIDALHGLDRATLRMRVRVS
jgi:hydroxyethylthiazole kinase